MMDREPSKNSGSLYLLSVRVPERAPVMAVCYIMHAYPSRTLGTHSRIMIVQVWASLGTGGGSATWKSTNT